MAVDLILPKISKLFSRAKFSSHINVTAAPSVNAEAVAAVTVPLLLNASFNLFNYSILLFGLMFSSSSQLFIFIISFLKFPLFFAKFAFS